MRFCGERFFNFIFTLFIKVDSPSQLGNWGIYARLLTVVNIHGQLIAKLFIKLIEQHKMTGIF